MAVAAVLLLCPAASAQFGQDWVVFVDPVTGERCGIVNSAYLELTVLENTGQLVIVTGADTLLSSLFVDANNNVYQDGFSAGWIGFADDADGFASVFWLTDRDTVVEIDEITEDLYDSGLYPDELGNLGCNACDFVDDAYLCDGVGDGGFICGFGAPSALIPILLLLTAAKLTARRR
jgi:hypothetical protein